MAKSKKESVMKRKTTVSAADELEAVPTVRTGPMNWFDALDDSIKNELLEIRERYELNACGGKSMRQVLDWCQKRWGIRVGRDSFTRWLRGEYNG